MWAGSDELGFGGRGFGVQSAHGSKVKAQVQDSHGFSRLLLRNLFWDLGILSPIMENQMEKKMENEMENREI